MAPVAQLLFASSWPPMMQRSCIDSVAGTAYICSHMPTMRRQRFSSSAWRRLNECVRWTHYDSLRLEIGGRPRSEAIPGRTSRAGTSMQAVVFGGVMGLIITLLGGALAFN